MYPTRRRWEFEPLEVRELLVADPFNLTQAANITADDIAGNSIVEFRITHGSDDAEEKRSGKMNITSNDLDHGKRTVGLRFNGIDIPMGANIVNAYLQYQADEAGRSSGTLAIYGEASDHALTFNGSRGNISSRPATNSSVSWSSPAWTTVGEAGPDQQTPNIATVIEEIVNRPGWAAGNSLALIVAGDAIRAAESYDAKPEAAALLHVEYASLPNEAPVVIPATLSIAENSPHNTSVGTVTASDPDAGQTLFFSITGGNTNSAFSIDGTTGEITVNNSSQLDFETIPQYVLTVTATDDGPDMLSDSALITIDVDNFNINAPSPFTFRGMGDVPYSSGVYDDLAADLAAVSSGDEFFIHVGDIKSGSTSCSQSVYNNVSDLLKTSLIPVFIVPGDNEWNDCPNPDTAWKHWEKHFTNFEDNWDHGFHVTRHSVRPEHFAFVENGVLFIGINLVGGDVHDAAEWTQRMTEDANWVNQNFNAFGNQVTTSVVFGHAFPDPNGGAREQFAQDFVAASQAFDKPILYLMGDKHNWKMDTPYDDAPKVTRIIVDKGVPSIRVTVTHDVNNPFDINR